MHHRAPRPVALALALALGTSLLIHAVAGNAIPLEYAQLATGFYPDSLATASQSCFKVSSKAQPQTSSSTLTATYYLYNQSSSSSYWNISDSASASYGKAHASGAVSETSEAASNDKSALWIDRFQYSIVQSVTMDQIELTSAGSDLVDAIGSATDDAQKKAAIDNFIQSCGTRIVTETFTGQSAAMVLELRYASARDKESFDTSETAGYGSMAELSNAIESTNTASSSSVAVAGRLYQLGGDSDTDTQIAANVTAISGCSVDPDSGALSNDCTSASLQFTTFIASAAYQQQLTADNANNAVIQYPTASALPVMLDTADQTALTAAIAGYQAVYRQLDDEWQTQEIIYQAMDAMTRGEVGGMTNSSLTSLMTSAKESAATNRNLLGGFLQECSNGVCPASYWTDYEGARKPISPLARSFAYLLNHGSSTFDTGMLFACDDNNVTITFDTANIAAVYLDNHTSENGTLTLTLPSLCATPGDAQNTTYIGYIRLNRISETSYLAYLPFVIQRDPVFPTLVVSQNDNNGNSVTIPSGGGLAGIQGSMSGTLATAASANSVSYVVNPSGAATVAPFSTTGQPGTQPTPTIHFDATITTTSLPATPSARPKRSPGDLSPTSSD
ncbi:hypothetical protein [Endothiovibrio diazotrophicus]